MRPELIEKFRAGSLERIRLAKLTLSDWEEGHVDPASLRRIVGELHTLKGESRMLGFATMSQLAHAVEECLAPAGQGRPLPAELSQASRGALDTIARSLRGELGPEPANSEALSAALRDLTRLTDELPEAAEIDPLPLAEVPPDEMALAMAAAGEAGEGAPAEVIAAPATQERWAQVKVSHVDELCERVHEFTTTFGQLFAEVRNLREGAGKVGLRPVLESFERCRTQLDELGSAAWSLRLVPIEHALGQLVEHARDLALMQNKRVRVLLDAGGVQLERGILDELWDSLLHLVRNAIDHGVEPPEERLDKPAVATVTIAAYSEGPNVIVTIAEDGRGIDHREIRRAAVARGLMSEAAAGSLAEEHCWELLFDHGFTTRQEVTEVSGRGVGLDVVRRKVESLGGKVSLATALGRGTTFTLCVPSTITRERLLVLSMGSVLLGLPSRSIVGVVPIDAANVGDVAGGRVLRYLGESVLLQSLAATLGFEVEGDEPYAIVLDLFGQRRAYGLKTLLGERELFRRPVDAALAGASSIGGSATLEDGRLVLLLRPESMVGRARAPIRARPKAPERRQRRVLVVDDSPIVRELLSEMLKGAGLAVDAAEDGLAALSAIESGRPDLVLSDVEMPRMDGLELLRRIRGKNQQLPVVMLTTRGSAQDKKAAAELGANAYLVKSDFEGNKLLDTVSRFINLKS